MAHQLLHLENGLAAWRTDSLKGQGRAYSNEYPSGFVTSKSNFLLGYGLKNYHHTKNIYSLPMKENVSKVTLVILHHYCELTGNNVNYKLFIYFSMV